MNGQLFRQTLTTTPVTLILMSGISLVSAAGLIRKRIFMALVLHPSSIVRQKQFYRLLTSDLVHVDLPHLLLNLTMLYFFGGKLEEHLNGRSPDGSFHFLLIYLAGLLAGGLVTTLRHRNDFGYTSAGASGSILGCAMSFMIFEPNKVAFYLPVIGGVKNKYDAFIFILVLVWYQRKSRNEMINHDLHIFGALGGLAAAIALYPDLL